MLSLYPTSASGGMSIWCQRSADARPIDTTLPLVPCRSEALFMKFPLSALTLLILADPTFAAADRPAAALDAIVAEALKAWPAPGLAIAVVRDDEVIYLKG